MTHDPDLLPEEAPGGTSSLKKGDPPPEGDKEPPPVALGPYTIEYLGRKGGLLALQICIGRHTVRLFATPGGIAARVSAEIDRWKLVRRRKRRPWRIWSRDVTVRRWVISAAAETDDGGPRWSSGEIARNLARTGRADMSRQAVRNLIWRLAPELAQRRADYWRVKQRKARKGAKRKPKRGAALAAEREAVIAELKKAGLL